MPANLPPQYHEAEKQYREAKAIPEKIEWLEQMLAIMPKHKGTDRLRAELRTRMAKLTEKAKSRHVVDVRGSGYTIRKEGAGQVVLVGLPNVGKSQLLASLTNALPTIADYPFTTRAPELGMMKFENIPIQIVDLPPVNDTNARPWLHNVLGGSDLLLIVVDLSGDVLAQVKTILDISASLWVKVRGDTAHQEEVFRTIKRALLVANKLDVPGAENNFNRLVEHYGSNFPIVAVSAKEGLGMEKLRGEIFRALEILRVYTKAPGREPDFTEPVILAKGSTIEEAARAIHKDFQSRLKYAQVWGSGKFDGQQVERNYQPQDGDVVEFHV